MTDGLKTPTGRIRKKTGYHHGNLRNSIIEAVTRLISESRSLDFQLKEVAKLVGTSTPAIYRHFESKQDLLVETAIAGYDLQLSYRAYAVEQAGRSPISRIMAIGYAYIHFARSHPGFFLLLKSMETEEILSSERYQAQRDETVQQMHNLVTECIAEGYFLDIDPGVAMASIQATGFGVANLYVGNQLVWVAPAAVGNENLVSELFKLHIGSLLSAKGKKALEDAKGDPFK
jgi:AcrR family transcriptional regulator